MNALQAISMDQARLPAAYEAAKAALSDCADLDECKEWGDKAAALASYAKQAEDVHLLKMAQRIKARAVRRSGELLKQIEPQQGYRSDVEPKAGDRPKFTRSDAARNAGMSKHKQKQAGRISNIEESEFEALIESDKPSTLTELATKGADSKPKPPEYLNGRTPEQFNIALHFAALVKKYAGKLREYDLTETLSCLDIEERAAVRKNIAEIDALHDLIATRI